MKKLLLSSIIMFGVCGIVSAQNATTSSDSKVKQKSVATTNSFTTATPQKSASAATNDLATPAAAVSADVDAARPAAKQNAARQATVTTTNAAGETVTSPAQAKQRADKLAAAKAANARKVNGN